MDALDQEIAARRRELATLKERVRELDVIVAALEKAAALRPGRQSPHTRDSIDFIEAVGSPTKGGRKQGDINKQWRDILQQLHRMGRPHKYPEIISAVAGLGHAISENAVRDRVRSFVRTGLMEGDAESGFAVTEQAVQRFGFTEENAQPDAGGAESEEGEPSSDPTTDAAKMIE